MTAGSVSLEQTFADTMEAALDGVTAARIGVAVSGGGDSMALMNLLAEWSQSRGITIEAITIDHGIRSASATEAEGVGQAAARLGIAHTTVAWTGWDGAGNLQDAARRARRDLIEEWAGARGIDAICLGHTLDDQAETFLMRLARGSGVDGLSGMPRVWKHGDTLWIRPLLGHRRQELRTYLTDRGVDWFEDPSNEDTSFDRVKARAALDHLAPLGLSSQRLAETADAMARAREALAARAADVAAEAVSVAFDTVLLDRAALAAVEDETSLRLLAHALCWVSGQIYRPRLRALRHLLFDGLAGRSGTLHGCRLICHGENLVVFREFSAVSGVTAGPGELWDGTWRLDGKDLEGCTIAALGTEGLGLIDLPADAPPKDSLVSTVSVWRGPDLVAVPKLGWGLEVDVKRTPSADSFVPSLFSH